MRSNGGAPVGVGGVDKTPITVDINGICSEHEAFSCRRPVKISCFAFFVMVVIGEAGAEI